jgi:hypothetical protein
VAVLKYLFCVTPEKNEYSHDVTGVGGDYPVSVERFDGLAAVFCDVSSDDFVGKDADARLNDLAWMAPRVIRHEEVIISVMKCGPVMPIRFGTIFSSLTVMKETLIGIRKLSLDFLEYITDKDEWDVQGFVDKASLKKRIQEKLVTEKSADLEQLSPGKRYFVEQRMKAEAEKKLSESLSGISHLAIDRLGAISSDFAERRLTGRERSGDETDLFFHWAFLVEKPDAIGFEAAVDAVDRELREQGYAFSISGPWPPYSFSPSLSGGT